MSLSRRSADLHLALAGAAVGFPSLHEGLDVIGRVRGRMIINDMRAGSGVVWEEVYQSLKAAFEQTTRTTLVRGGAWDVILQLEAEHIFRLNELTALLDLPGSSNTRAMLWTAAEETSKPGSPRKKQIASASLPG